MTDDDWATYTKQTHFICDVMSLDETSLDNISDINEQWNNIQYAIKLAAKDTLQKFRVINRYKFNVDSILIRHRHDIVMKNRFDIFKLNLNTLIQYLFVTNRSDIESTSRSEEHTSELQSHSDLVCRLLL